VRIAPGLVATLLVLGGPRLAGQGLEVVTTFNSDQGQPSGKLVEGPDGVFFGTTNRGGRWGQGSVYRLAPTPAPSLTEIHAFTTVDGTPAFRGGLVQGPGGYMYGSVSGSGEYGSVYRIDPSGRVALLHQFTVPFVNAGELLYASDGHLYGANPPGGVAHAGTIFRVEDDGSTTILHEFEGSDGVDPEAPLMQASDGWIYGTTEGTGLAPGTIFRMSLSGQFELLHTLSESDEGFHIAAGLAEGPNGYLYGGSYDHGVNGFGAIFRVNAAGDFQKLHDIDQEPDGYAFLNTLVFSPVDGEFWGVMREGGCGYGTIFKVHPEGSFTTMYCFGGGFDGGHPSSPLTVGSDGWLYGTGGQLDQNRLGSVYRIGLGGIFEVLWRFSNDEPTGIQPGVVEGQDGRLYGAKSSGGANGYGTLFAVSKSGDVEYLHDFDGLDGGGQFALMRVGDGSIYGVSDTGGENNRGTIFRYNGSSGFSLLHQFQLGEGANPSCPLVEATDGNFYGATLYGGAGEGGTIFRMTDDGTVTTIHEFQAQSGAPNHLLQAQNGTLVGTSTVGNPTDGAVFTLDLAGGGFQNLVSFDAPTTGAPPTGLIQASSGDLFGTGQHGGANGAGTIFRVDSTPALSVVHTFEYPTGQEPLGGVVAATDGYLYGTTSSGGPMTYGTLFRISPLGEFESLWTFHGTDGAHPSGQLLPASDGALYGTARGGYGTPGSVIYRWVLSPPAPTVDSVEPNSGPALSPTILQVHGAHFQFQPQADLAGTPSTRVVGLDSRTVSLRTPALVPGSVANVTISNPDGSSSTLAGAYFADFLDVDSLHTFHDFVESIFRAEITAGCGGGRFCVVDAVTRERMAVFLLKAEHGGDYVPPPCTGVFADVPCTPGVGFPDWIERLYAEGITGGCIADPLQYCPVRVVTRAEMAVFLLKTALGTGYLPNPCAGLFADVPCPATPEFPFSDWIEQLYADGITGGCTTGPLRYCPDNPSLRGEMAVFLTKTFLQ
jgi:uncharacterized repeat protein (TIGR03803 family)